MWHKVSRYLLYGLIWSFIVGYVIYSSSLSRSYRESHKVDRVEIIILDSAMHGNLITTPMVRGWLSSSGVKIVGRGVEELPIGDMEAQILQNGFVEQVKIYPTYSGALRIELTQRRPVMRMLVNGYNCYATSEGYVFEAPHYASLYVPVVTGSYRPPFPASYRGDVEDFMRSKSKEIANEIQDIDREKYPLYERQEENMDDRREVNRMFIDQGFWEDDDAFDKRVMELRAHKNSLRRLYKYRDIVIDKEIAKITNRQNRLHEEEKKLKKRCEDFAKLINFVEIVEDDKFWSSEIVQIVASQSQRGDLRVSFSVRSGDFLVTFGEVDNEDDVHTKLDKLYEFYESGLRRVGWSKYRNINVEYKNQVVCK